MKSLRFAAILAAALSIAYAGTAHAGASWTQLSFATQPQNAPELIAAADQFLGSKLGKTFPGRLLLQVHVADGANPATHSFVPIYANTADREKFVQSMQQDPAWQTFLGVLTEKTQATSQMLLRSVRSWGDVNDTDTVWMAHAFTVNDPRALGGALEAFLASPTGKKFPGQVHLSQVVAGGGGPVTVTHLITVGYASEVEMDSWGSMVQTTDDWARYMEASQKAATYRGGSLARTVKTWGDAKLADLVK